MADPISRPSATLTGVVERIIFLNEENHYTIAEFRPEALPATAKSTAGRPDMVTITGALPGVECGETLQLTGEWTRHAQHGDQFKVVTFKSELPAGVYGIRKYLGSGLVPGIGRVYANKIVDAFGTDTFRVLSEESARLRDVPGIGRKRALAIKSAWDEKRAERELYIFLQTYGVTPSQCVKLVQKYSGQAKNVLLNEPYRVAREIDGIGFKTADRIAINLGFANDAPPRLDAGIVYALETLAEEGHTAFGETELRDHATQLLETTAERVAARINALVEARDLIRHTDETPKAKLQTARIPAAESARTSGPTTNCQLPTTNPIIQLPSYDRAEQRIASVVGRLTRTGSGLPPIKADAAVAWAEKKAGFEFHELQRRALRSALTHKFSILTGGPGTGKTTILRALVDILRAKKVRVHLAAPTGRAAQRLAETTGGFAATIHRLLKYDPAGGGFVANESAPLATDFLVVDEASMLDTRLASALFQAVPSRAHLVLVGDTDQLPSVGAGNVLKDLIRVALATRSESEDESASRSSISHLPSPISQIPVTRLDVIYRQKGQSQIVTTAHAINGGDPSIPPAVKEVADVQVWNDLTFVMADSAEDCLQKVIQLCTEFIPRQLKWPHPVNDVQVLAPMHKGVAGVANLNAQLQAALNPPSAPARPGRSDAVRTAGGEFRPGDKVIQLRNDYEKNLFNGDIGVVRAVDPGAGKLVIEFDGEKHEFDRSNAGNLALAYCISIHKCVAADTWVLTTTGWQQIGELWPAQKQTGRLHPIKVRLAGPHGTIRSDQIYRGAVEPAIRLVTRHGYELTGSHRHPVQVYEPAMGRLVWKKMPQLRRGDFLPLRRNMGLFPVREYAIRYRPAPHSLRRIIPLPATVNTDVALMLGYLVGDGSYDERRDGDVRLTNADRPLVRNYARILRQQFGLRPTLSRSTARKTAPTWYVISRTFREWLCAAGLDHATARIKKVPVSILRSPRAVQAAFLRGLFDTDGSASGQGTRVVLATTSQLLADQVRMMLLNFGIVTARLYIKASDSWRVEMYGANLRLFEERIGFGLKTKARQLRRMAKRGEGWNGKTNVDIIPGADALWRELRAAIRRQLGPTRGRPGQGVFAQSFLARGFLLSRLALPSCRTNYTHLDQLLPAIGRRWPWAKYLTSYQALESLRRTRYFFDPVIRIERTRAAMFDLHVPHTHAFLTNGFISHNSQGSEYPVVIIPLLKAHFMMLQRNLLYTAITRGRKKVYLVGEPAAFGMAVRNNESRQRITHLKEKLVAAAGLGSDTTERSGASW